MIKRTIAAAIVVWLQVQPLPRLNKRPVPQNMWNTAQVNIKWRQTAFGATGLSVLALVARSTLATMTVRLRLATEFRRLSM